MHAWDWWLQGHTEKYYNGLANVLYYTTLSISKYNEVLPKWSFYNIGQYDHQLSNSWFSGCQTRLFSCMSNQLDLLHDSFIRYSTDSFVLKPDGSFVWATSRFLCSQKRW